MYNNTAVSPAVMLEKLHQEQRDKEKRESFSVNQKLKGQISNLMYNLGQKELMHVEQEVQDMHGLQKVFLPVIEESKEPHLDDGNSASKDLSQRYCPVTLLTEEDNQDQKYAPVTILEVSPRDFFRKSFTPIKERVYHQQLNKSFCCTGNQNELPLDLKRKSMYVKHKNNKSLLDQSVQSLGSNNSFLRNELQSVLQKNLSHKNFMKDLVIVTKKFQKHLLNDGDEHSHQGSQRGSLISLTGNLSLNYKILSNELSSNNKKKSCLNKDLIMLMNLLLKTLNDIIEVSPTIISEDVASCQQLDDNVFCQSTVQSQSPEIQQEEQSKEKHFKMSNQQLVLLDMDTQTDKLRVEHQEIQVNLQNLLTNDLKCVTLEIEPIIRQLNDLTHKLCKLDTFILLEPKTELINELCILDTTILPVPKTELAHDICTLDVTILPVPKNNLQQSLQQIELSIIELKVKEKAPTLSIQSYLSCHVIRPVTVLKERIVQHKQVAQEVKKQMTVKSALMQSVAPSTTSVQVKETREIEVQTERKELITTACDSQPLPLMKSTQIQTTAPSLKSTIIQTDHSKFTSISSTQTEKQIGTSISIQASVSQIDHDQQTTILNFQASETQTNVNKMISKETITADLLDLKETSSQTQDKELQSTHTQTQVKEYATSKIQTEVKEYTANDMQTDIQEFAGTGMQTEVREVQSMQIQTEPQTKHLESVQIQTVSSSLNSESVEVQTYAKTLESTKVQTEVQTKESHSIEIQTENWEFASSEMQTEIKTFADCQIQTAGPQCSQHETQTLFTSLSQTQSDTQTESQQVASLSTQTARQEAVDGEAQTLAMQSSHMETQTSELEQSAQSVEQSIQTQPNEQSSSQTQTITNSNSSVITQTLISGLYSEDTQTQTLIDTKHSEMQTVQSQITFIAMETQTELEQTKAMVDQHIQTEINLLMQTVETQTIELIKEMKSIDIQTIEAENQTVLKLSKEIQTNEVSIKSKDLASQESQVFTNVVSFDFTNTKLPKLSVECQTACKLDSASLQHKVVDINILAEKSLLIQQELKTFLSILELSIDGQKLSLADESTQCDSVCETLSQTSMPPKSCQNLHKSCQASFYCRLQNQQVVNDFTIKDEKLRKTLEQCLTVCSISHLPLPKPLLALEQLKQSDLTIAQTKPQSQLRTQNYISCHMVQPTAKKAEAFKSNELQAKRGAKKTYLKSSLMQVLTQSAPHKVSVNQAFSQTEMQPSLDCLIEACSQTEHDLQETSTQCDLILPHIVPQPLQEHLSLVDLTVTGRLRPLSQIQTLYDLQYNISGSKKEHVDQQSQYEQVRFKSVISQTEDEFRTPHDSLNKFILSPSSRVDYFNNENHRQFNIIAENHKDEDKETKGEIRQQHMSFLEDSGFVEDVDQNQQIPSDYTTIEIDEVKQRTLMRTLDNSFEFPHDPRKLTKESVINFSQKTRSSKSVTAFKIKKGNIQIQRMFNNPSQFSHVLPPTNEIKNAQKLLESLKKHSFNLNRKITKVNELNQTILTLEEFNNYYKQINERFREYFAQIGVMVKQNNTLNTDWDENNSSIKDHNKRKKSRSLNEFEDFLLDPISKLPSRKQRLKSKKIGKQINQRQKLSRTPMNNSKMGLNNSICGNYQRNENMNFSIHKFQSKKQQFDEIQESIIPSPPKSRKTSAIRKSFQLETFKLEEKTKISDIEEESKKALNQIEQNTFCINFNEQPYGQIKNGASKPNLKSPNSQKNNQMQTTSVYKDSQPKQRPSKLQQLLKQKDTQRSIEFFKSVEQFEQFKNSTMVSKQTDDMKSYNSLFSLRSEEKNYHSCRKVTSKIISFKKINEVDEKKKRLTNKQTKNLVSRLSKTTK